MNAKKLLYILLFYNVLFLSSLCAQHKIVFNADSISDNVIPVSFKGLFKINSIKRTSNYYFINATLLDSITIDSSLIFFFGKSVDDLKQREFSILTCNDSNIHNCDKILVGDTVYLDVATPDGMWYSPGCMADDDHFVKVEDICKSVIMIPYNIIKTQLLVTNTLCGLCNCKKK